jgi:DegV family protein with EDD domain
MEDAMSSWRLVADSSCDLKVEDLSDSEVGFSTVPLTIHVGDTVYPDIPSTDTRKMLTHMKEYKHASSSSCPSPADFAQEIAKAANCIVVTITSGLSGTYNSAMQAMRMVMEENPDNNVHVIDSRATSGSLVLILHYVRRLIADGLSFEGIIKKADAYRDNVHLLFALASFDNLVKTGRMPKAAGMLATALNIRAVATANTQGTIEVLEKPRGQKKAIERMVARMLSIKDIKGLPVVISHCNNLEGANILRSAVLEACPEVGEILILDQRCLNSFYAGDQSLLIGF